MLRSLTISITVHLQLNPLATSRNIVRMSNQSEAEQFDTLYGRVWRAFFKGDSRDLSQHERQLLHHIQEGRRVPLGDVARHLGIPKSSASEQVKSLERRGFLTRGRDRADERRLAIVLTPKGAARVRSDSVLDLRRLAIAMHALSKSDLKALLEGLGKLAGAVGVDAGERPST
jgi:DNA-binding MarR family transcriptional regulator